MSTVHLSGQKAGEAGREMFSSGNVVASCGDFTSQMVDGIRGLPFFAPEHGSHLGNAPMPSGVT
jgi:hypothetical protein